MAILAPQLERVPRNVAVGAVSARCRQADSATGCWKCRCMLSTVPPIPTANPVGSGFSLASGQTEIIDVSTTPVLDLNGNLNNQGTIYLVSTNPLVRSVSISAQNIFDGGGALITTVLPSGGLPGYSNAINNLSLTLVASTEYRQQRRHHQRRQPHRPGWRHHHQRTSRGSSAGLARMQAVGELDLLAATVVNHGVVSSTAGNVDVAVPSIYASAARPFADGTLPAALPQNININNTSGTIQALNGTINFGGMELGQTALLSLTGGNLDRSSDQPAGRHGRHPGRREQRHRCGQCVWRLSSVCQ